MECMDTLRAKMREFVEELRERPEGKGRLAQWQLADLVPTTAATLSRVLNGKLAPNLTLTRSIARVFTALGCPIDGTALFIECNEPGGSVSPKPVRSRKVRDGERAKVERIEQGPDLGQVAEDKGEISHAGSLQATGTGR